MPAVCTGPAASQFNGYSAGLETFVKVMETLAAADASTAWCLGRRSAVPGRGVCRAGGGAGDLGR